MKSKKIILILITAIFLASIAGVCAADANDTLVASEDTSQIELSDSNKIIEDNLQTSEENDELTLTDNDVLGADSATYSDLDSEICASGNVTLTHKNYIYDDGATAITITEDNKVIDGNGAIIDMTGSTIRAFDVIGNGVTIKNLTIKNVNFWEKGGAIKFAGDSGTVINCNFINNTAQNGGAIYFDKTGNVENCNFNDNTASRYGGAVYFLNAGNVTNCNFINNKATADISCGGAISMSSGSVTNCNFADNEAYQGSAVYFSNNGEVRNCNLTGNTANYGGAISMFSGSVTNCNFTNNQATGTNSWGGAIIFLGTGNVTNCNFADNSAYEGGAIFSSYWSTADTCIFKTGSDTTFNIGILPPMLNVDNFTTFYGSGEKLTFDLKTNSNIPVTNGNIPISVYFKDDNSWVGNYRCLSGEGWAVSLPVGSYYANFTTEYAGFQAISRTITITIPNVRYYINVTSITTNNKTVNITAKSNIPKNILWDGKLLFILPNGKNITANYADNGTWWAVHRFDDYGVYQVSASYIGLDNVTINNATITVSKVNTVLTADAVTATYNINRDLVITLKDTNGNALSGAKLTVDLNGAREYVTDANGQVKVNVAKLVPKTYTAIITFNGDDIYAKSTKNVQVIVKKAKAKIVAKKKTFKKAKKVKKYTATLKNNVGNAMKKVKLTLKVKGKTYKAKTNAKGKAVFKIKNLKKKGKYRATVKFAGNNYYSKVTKKVKTVLQGRTAHKLSHTIMVKYLYTIEQNFNCIECFS